ncbi:hypothetical protein ACFCX4_29520 [Kitasatospora sp. NPDC056327]|uniref:hypothetical protein n=1 Tax=Kitasatospora sp. NPDC056327 TaxID=3345785 RepID=UPI0035E21C38
MGTRKLGRAAAAAAVVAATVAGGVVGAAGSADASGIARIIERPECKKSKITVETWAVSQWDAKYLCGGGFGEKAPVFRLNDGTEQTFFVGADRAVWTFWFPPRGSAGLASLGGAVTSDPRIVAYEGDFIQLDVKGTDGKLWYNNRNTNGVWTGWFR